MRAALRAEGLSQRFKKRRALHRFSLSLYPGELLGLLGPNGAGKTTTFRILSGLLKPQEGRVFLGEQEISAWPLWRRARAGLGYLPQEPSVFKDLSVAQNLRLPLRRLKLSRAEHQRRLLKLLRRFELLELEDVRGDRLSGGERRRLEIARALALRPQLLLLDEPFAGLDPKGAAALSSLLQSLVREGIGILLTDHDARQTLDACDRVYILDHGELLMEGQPAEVAADKMVQRRYLGERASPADEGMQCLWK